MGRVRRGYRSVQLHLSQLPKRERDIKRLYGLTMDDYEALLENQGGLCAICHRPDPLTRALAVDHCHSTGRVRGLLCSRCNKALGAFQDDLKVLIAALHYLTKET